MKCKSRNRFCKWLVFLNTLLASVNGFAVTKSRAPNPSVRSYSLQRVDVILNNEFSEFDVHTARTITDTVREVVRLEEPVFLSMGLKKIVVRPLVADVNFVELLGYNQKNQIVGNFLVQEKLASAKKYIRSALSNMQWAHEHTHTPNRGKIILSQVESIGLRAYLNGFPLKQVEGQPQVTFELNIPEGFDSDRNVVMITGSHRPIVGRVLGKSMLLRTHKWAMPPERIAHR